MSDLNLSNVTAPPSVQTQRPVDPPKPPKSQSDYKPANETTDARGPAVVLSGALATSTGGSRKDSSQNPSSQGSSNPAQTNSITLGQTVNQVV
ncbi:MAG TPA: hypothetical protein VFE10_15470 [Phenylobacterium sp.]|jgi:hypothetical protein|nr:hypothetical protein [Phenylobacterium sp.]